MSSKLTTIERGAHGVHLAGLPTTEWFSEAPDTWTRLSIEHRSNASMPDGLAVMSGPEGIDVALDAEAARLLVGAPAGIQEFRWAHPIATMAGVLHATTIGRGAVHAGSFIAPGGLAWLVLGPRGAGKTSTLLALHERGLSVLSDDLTTFDDDRVFTGTRHIDVRAETAQARGLEGPRVRDRTRVTLFDAPMESAWAGTILLGWGDDTSTRAVGLAERGRRVVDQTHDAVEGGINNLLPLLTRPVIELARPRNVAELDAVVDVLLDAIS